MRTPRFTEAQDGSEAPQSAHNDSGCRCLPFENILEGVENSFI
jgi:hypothetical protein